MKMFTEEFSDIKNVIPKLMILYEFSIHESIYKLILSLSDSFALFLIQIMEWKSKKLKIKSRQPASRNFHITDDKQGFFYRCLIYGSISHHK